MVDRTRIPLLAEAAPKRTRGSSEASSGELALVDVACVARASAQNVRSCSGRRFADAVAEGVEDI